MIEQRWENDPARVAIVLPGNGYTAAMPLLYWSSKVLYQFGWTIEQVWYPEDRPRDFAEVVPWVAEVVDERVRAERARRPDVELLLVGKSYGTFAIPYAATHQLRGIWLTPVLRPPRYAGGPDPIRDALADLPPSLFVGGTADPMWDVDPAIAGGHETLDIPGADHGIEDDGDYRNSLAWLARVAAAVESYASSPPRE